MSAVSDNPLLDFTDLTHFDRITPADVEPAIRHLLDTASTTLATLEAADTPATWDDFVIPMTEATEHLGRAWGVVGHMHSVMDTPQWRAAYNDLLPEISGFYAELGQNEALYGKYRALHDSAEYANLSPVRQRIIDHELRDFRLSGAELPEAQKPRFKAISEEQSALGAKFSENLLDATNAFAEWVTDEAELAGLPEDVVAAARAAAEKEDRPGWKFTLQAPSYVPVMQYADSARLREVMYRANGTRASEHGKPEWDNGPIIGRLLALAAEEAKMLGYASYAELSLVPKMADSPEHALSFLRELGVKAKPYAERDLAELKAFAAKELGIAELNPWDMGYASEKLRQARYAFSENEVRQYFPEPRVLDGLFGVIESLYGVQLSHDRAAVWDPSVKVLRIERAGQLIGQLYLDLHARDTKRGGAWMDSARNRQRSGSRLLTPVAYVVCNFSPPVGDKPATLTHDDVVTLFHEFGHALHHLLTEVDEVAVSGIHGVEWDAVELPSQFMENFCWEWDVLSGMSAHVNTGEPLPRELFDKMLAARHFQSGMQMVRQLEFSLFDLRLYHEVDATQPVPIDTVLSLLEDVRKEVAVTKTPAWHRFPLSFSHIFAGGYSAGYYSYKWAEVLSADAFAAFEEAGEGRGSLLDAATGQRFWREILAVGGSRPALESFIAFRGREPQVDALLRHSGMLEAA
ncbi:M3 family metallopeptidase [Denitromonas ohlonensis]|uniref:oligopeptidase A n=2 Tax=Denitromonas TaxID=139331 RepID=A0A557R5F3_9RHOO|nr:M3 family metallopeptidase [Denitromonas ohlonensis]TVO60393.1 M3 family metallopeptidase [Denitromonas ohlonensis]TVO78558.1 M3 family metallopeptidase [Denitromonas ohlonensis]